MKRGAAMSEDPDEESLWNEAWLCGKEIAVTRRLFDAIERHGSFEGHPGGEKVPPFLIGNLPSPYPGMILFVMEQQRWTGYAVQEGAGAQGIYCAPRTGTAVIFAMHISGDPGVDYTVVHTRDGFKTIGCTTLPFPGELNQPSWQGEFLSFRDFNADESGRGALVGSADVVRDDRDATWWFRYETADAGASWSAPPEAG